MAVAFDAVGPSGGAGTSITSGTTLSWTHTCGASATLLLVGVTVGYQAVNNTATCTYNGVSMTSLGAQQSNNGADGYVQMFALANPATGSNTVAVSTSNTATTGAPTLGGSISYTGASGTQNVTTAYGSSATPSVTISSATGNMTAAFMGCSSGFTANNQTLRYQLNLSNNNAAGNLLGEDAAGASSVTLTGTHPSDWWGAIGVDIIASSGGGGGNVVAWIGA